MDLDKKTGLKMPTPLLPQLRKRLESEGKSMTEFGKELLVQMGGKKVGEENFLSKPCEVWEVKALGSKSWVWQGVTLKLSVDFAGQKMLTEAVRVDENVQVPESRLAVPGDVKIAEGKNPLDQLKGIREKKRPGR